MLVTVRVRLEVQIYARLVELADTPHLGCGTER